MAIESTLTRPLSPDREELNSDVPNSVDLFGGRHDASFYEVTGTINEKQFDEMLMWAGDRKASDITIQTDEPVIAEIGGENAKITSRPFRTTEIDFIVRYLYGEHGPGMLKAGYDLDCSHDVRMGAFGRRRYRVNMTAGRVPGGDGVQITIRTLPVEPIELSKLDLEPDLVANIRPDNGLVLVTGPTGSGKSTLLSSMIRNIIEKPDAHEKVLEFSSPIEYVYDGVIKPTSSVWQTEVGRHLVPHTESGAIRSGHSLFSHAVRNALRRAPSIIMIGETRDLATMEASMSAALTGHLVYSTLHNQSVPAAMRRIVQFFPGDQRESAAVDIMETLRVVVTQILRPRVGGGRVALREYMIFDDRIRSQFLKKPTEQWPAMARQMLDDKKVLGRKMTSSAWEAFTKGIIDEQVLTKLVEAERNQR